MAWITINRPQALNALNRQALLELEEALREAGRDPEVRAVILTGAGEKAFCAGLDLKEAAVRTPLEARELSKLGHKVFKLIEELPKPVIAAVSGYAMGGGMELVLSCDLAIASENAVFSQAEVNVGVTPGWGATQRLWRLVGVRRAKMLVLTGDRVSAVEAEKLGIVNRVVPHEKLKEEAEALALKLAEKSPVALRIAKEQLNKALENTLSPGLDYEAEAWSLLFSTHDAHEGVRAFVEKRRPMYKGE
ncbi:MAG: enoyl-CoA hydratase-related protein [Candidatus Nezhaarchaeota archaeon]|nr:enoyl-CoA hydratase-related protein [Candidatus Nezhaarchaeota archaeon]